MSSQTGYQLILCVICGLLTSLSQGQPAMSCTTCPVGYTCSMVRHGTGRPQPGCITMQEAIMLNQAMQGGPSGPGTGISVPSTLGAPQNTMPGMEWGSNAPGGQGSGFGQRFNQGIIGTPATMFNPQAPNSLAFGGASQPGMQLRGTGQTGMPFGAPPGQFSGQTGFGGSPGGFPQGGPMVGGFGAPPGFIDPTTGQGFDQGPFRRVNDQSTGTNHLHDRSGSGTSGVDVGSGFSACVWTLWCPGRMVCIRTWSSFRDRYIERCISGMQIMGMLRFPRRQRQPQAFRDTRQPWPRQTDRSFLDNTPELGRSSTRTFDTFNGDPNPGQTTFDSTRLAEIRSTNRLQSNTSPIDESLEASINVDGNVKPPQTGIIMSRTRAPSRRTDLGNSRDAQRNVVSRGHDAEQRNLPAQQTDTTRNLEATDTILNDLYADGQGILGNGFDTSVADTGGFNSPIASTPPGSLLERIEHPRSAPSGPSAAQVSNPGACITCSSHADCKQNIFSYCIDKPECGGKVCHIIAPGDQV
ncbi:uncharacterized protein LOC128218765 isoform X2 [Mya arenaria]|uniref:uncharacterized protein LOC128218765 isoform X2 n=1 Tax=Mya arenaria TaxID=6604 RepID=UPI0022E2C6EF|nr:uncharacterized protein LOC128218765 isoform X2 [Mya arenaria]